MINKKGFIYLLKAFTRKVFYYPVVIFFTFKINFLKPNNENDALNKVFNNYLEILKPSQVKKEIKHLIKVLKRKNISNVLEIGTAQGGTFFLFSFIAEKDSKLISVDLPKGKFGGGYSSVRIPLYKSFSSKNKQIYLLRSDSHKEETKQKVKEKLNGELLDFLFIDGDHTYKGVKSDFFMYKDLVKKEGIIAFHDIVNGSKDKVGGVPKFWQEIKKEYDHEEIVDNWEQEGYGIGVLFL